tara:strand:- start:295 stop:1635 length:1341 start_codon:yes stop_codon:yes gene_type:complete
MVSSHQKRRWKVLLPIETSQRELLYKTILACFFVDRGYDCYIGSKKEIYNLFDKIGPFIYFDKGYHKGKSEVIHDRIKDNSGLIVSLDEEGAIDYLDSRTLLSRYTKRLFINSDLVFLWGRKQRDLLDKNNLLNYNCPVFVSGHPRFELLKENYHYFYNDEVNKIKIKHGNFILVSTNMSLGNNVKGDQFILDNYRERKKGYLEDLMKYDTEKMEFIIKFIKNIRSKTDKKIIIRPHPEENVVYYQKELAYVNNIEVINKGSSIVWIAASDLLVHPDCTTGVEALYLNKKAISLLPYFNQDLTSFLPVQLSQSFNDIDQATKEILNNNKSMVDKDKFKKESLEEYFNINSNPIHIITEKIDQLINNYNTLNEIELSSLQIYKIKVLDIFAKLYAFFQSKAVVSFRKQKLGGLDFNEVKKIILLCQSTNLTSKTKIDRISNGLFKLH